MQKINWQYAFGEIFLIFIGITLAIAFQNWNEKRKEHNMERAALQQISIALQNDLKDINANINTHTRGIKGCQEALEILSSDTKLKGPEVIQKMVQIIDFTFLVSDVSAYEYLKSVGLQLIKNDSVRAQISNLYDVIYEGVYGVENNSEHIQKNLTSSIRKYYSASGDEPFFVFVGDANRLKNDNQLKFDIKNMEFSHSIMKRRYVQKVKPELEKLIQMVENELN